MYIINQSMLEVCLSARPSFSSSNSFGFLWFKLQLALQLSIQLDSNHTHSLKTIHFRLLGQRWHAVTEKSALNTGIGGWMHPHMLKSRLEWSTELWGGHFIAKPRHDHAIFTAL